jgi:hypothetical protein
MKKGFWHSAATKQKISNSKKGSVPHNKAPRVKINCYICGNDIFIRPKEVGDRKYCGHVCAVEGQRGKPAHNKKVPIKRVCNECDKEYHVRPSAADSIYCSRKCHHHAMKKVTGPEHPLYIQSINKICLVCGKEFLIKPCHERRGMGKFCSRRCQGAWTMAHCSSPSSFEVVFARELDRAGIKYNQQVLLGGFVADFVLPDTLTIIEIDGDYWHDLPKVKARDARKDAYYKHIGYVPIHFRLGHDADYPSLIKYLLESHGGILANPDSNLHKVGTSVVGPLLRQPEESHSSNQLGCG